MSTSVTSASSQTPHHHHHHHHSDLAAANRDHWNEHAAKLFDEPWVLTLVAQIGKFITSDLPFFGLKSGVQDGTFLDYACGAGTITSAVAPYFSSVTGMDITEAMLARYRAAFPDETKFKVIKGDLITPASPEVEIGEFDVVALSMALHHMADAADVIKKLSAKVKAGGGRLVIVDWITEGGDENYEFNAKHTITYDGFVKEEMEKWMKEAGLEEFGWKVAEEESRIPAGEEKWAQRRVFFAVGKKI